MVAQDVLSYQEILPLDRFILHSLALHCKQVNEYYDQFLYNKVILQTQFFVGSTLSSFYFDLLKDRLYCESINSKQRKSANTVMFHVLNNLKASISPILPVLCREVTLHSNTANESSDKSTLFYQYSVDERWLDYHLQEEIEFLVKLKEDIKGLLKDSLKSEDAILTKDLNKLDMFILPLSNDCKDILMKFNCDELREIFQASTISICATDSDFENISRNYIAEGTKLGLKNNVKVKLAEAKRSLCPRCRLYLNDKENDEDSLCQRCENVIKSCTS